MISKYNLNRFLVFLKMLLMKRDFFEIKFSLDYFFDIFYHVWTHEFDIICVTCLHFSMGNINEL